jgi:TolB-like protein
VIIGLLAIAVVFLVVDNYFLESEPEQVEVAAESVPAAEPIAREKSIAVLPFANISPDPEDAYFADGIHDEVLAQISKIRDLKVISRTSVMRYRGEDRPTSPEIAAALGVANILEGSVRLAGNQVRITTQLIEAESDAHLWTETYDRELTAANIFAIQTDIAKAVADALRATLSPIEQERLAIKPTKNTDAYLAYLLGKERIAKLSTVAFAEAVDHFQQAIKLDPSFALAYVGLADAYIWQSNWSVVPPEEGLAKAQVAVDKALALDDQLGEAYNSLAGILQERGDFEVAEATYQRALELSPNYATAYQWYGEFLNFGGRPQEALALHRKAFELDPLSAAVIDEVGADLFQLGRFDEALAWYEKALEVDPGFTVAYISIGDYYRLALGRPDEAVVWYARAISLDADDSFIPTILGRLFLDLGDPHAAEYWIQRSIELNPDSRYTNLSVQLLHFYREDESSLDSARKAIANFPRMWPVLAFLRNHELREGRPAEARTLYERIRPALLSEDNPNVDYNNYEIAIDLALVLIRTGEQERADLLLDRSLEYIQTVPRLGLGHWIADVQIYALQGEKKKALAALRQAIDEGWRAFWWYFLKRNPNLESLHDEPEYQAMVEEIEADMAAQLERVREMERRGELPPIPPIGSTPAS